MSYMIAVPDMLSSAAGDLASIGSSINASTRAAAAATTRLLPAAADEVSAHIAALFSGHGEGYQAIARQMAAFHDQFTLALTSSAGAYASAEATNVEQQVLGLINAPTQALLGRPLIGNGADGTAANPNGGAGGLLYGNGGNGFSQTTAGLTGGTGGSAGLIGNGGNGGAVLDGPARVLVDGEEWTGYAGWQSFGEPDNQGSLPPTKVAPAAPPAPPVPPLPSNHPPRPPTPPAAPDPTSPSPPLPPVPPLPINPASPPAPPG